MAITAPTPMMMPSMVRLERSLLRASARIAIRMMASRSISGGSILQRRQVLQDVGRQWPVDNLLIPPDLSVTEMNRSSRKLRNIGLVSDQNDGETVVVELPENFHDLD